MKKLELINHPFLKLPIVWRGEYASYFNAVKSIGNAFLELLKQVDKNEFKNDNSVVEEYTKERVVAVAQNCLETALKCLEAYLEEGSPSMAFEEFHNHFSLSGKYGDEAPVRAFEYDGLFPQSYRIRKSAEIVSEVKEMFHVPFEERHKVKSFRYSIPGYPTLYMANCLYVAFMELGEFNFDHVYASKFMHKKWGQGEPQSLLDLRNESRYTRDIFLARWPLIMACSLRVGYPDSEFKPEYILPQILLQWTKRRIKIGKDRRVLGVMYSSSKIPSNKTGFAGEFYNIAIPADRAGEVGYCGRLKDLFELTKPISFSKALGIEIPTEQITRVHSILDLWNNEVSYKSTGFAKVETILDKQPYNQLYSL